MREKRNSSYTVLVGNPKGKEPEDQTRPEGRRLDNIKMNIREIGWNVMDWIDLA
jgi:hypothetical protein